MAPGLTRAAEAEYLARRGLQFVLGLDEAGRGPLAGPVVAAAVLLLDSAPTIPVEGIMDSKMLVREEAREACFEELVNHPRVLVGVSIVSHEEIDIVNILQASLLAMKRAADDLFSKYPGLVDGSKCLALADGNAVPGDMPSKETLCVIKGDTLIYSIAAASIIAKVTRDRIMRQQHDLYPEYAFSLHKGYPTLQHRQALMLHGPCAIHRKTYSPVKLALERQAANSPQKSESAKSAGKRSRAGPLSNPSSLERRQKLDMSTPPPSPAKTRRRR